MRVFYPPAQQGPAPVITENSDDWWAGAQQCFVGLAVAAAAALTSTSILAAGLHQSNEDFVPTPVVAPGDGAAVLAVNQRALTSPVYLKWYAQDELPTAVVAALDETEWTPPLQPAAAAFVLPTWDDQVLSWALDELYDWKVPVVVTPTITSMVWRDDDYVPPAVITLDEDVWQFPVVAPVASFLPSQWDDQVLSWTQEEIYTTWTPSAVATPTVSFLVWTDTDFAPVAAASVVDDSSELVLSVPPVLPARQVWTVDDDVVPVVTTVVDEIYQWEPPTQSFSALVKVWYDDAELPLLTIDEVYWQVPVVDLVPTIVQPFLYDEIYFSPVTPLLVDETDWPLPKPVVRLSDPQVWTVDDQFIATVALLGVDEVYWAFPQPPLLQPVNRVWATDDPFAIPVQPLSDEDGPTFPQTSYSANVIIWAVDDEITPFAEVVAKGGGGGLPFYGQREQVKTKFQRWAAEDSLPIAAAPLSVPEDDPAVQITPPPVIKATLWQESEDIVPRPGLDEVYWIAPQPTLAKVSIPVWQETDEVVTAAATIVDEVYPVDLQLVKIGPIVTVWGELEDVVPQAATILDEEYWLGLPQAKTQPILSVWQDSHDDRPTPTPTQPFDHDSYWPFNFMARYAPPIPIVWSAPDNDSTQFPDPAVVYRIFILNE